MAKPLISSTFFSFPKLLVWSLPLLFILIYTYLVGDIRDKLSTLVLSVWHPVNNINGTAPVRHDASFSPDYSRRVTQRPFSQSCITKLDVILVNGTSPGPEIRLLEGNVYWIRVYNDMDNQNLTMVPYSLLGRLGQSLI
jgi:hypothetical protein